MRFTCLFVFLSGAGPGKWDAVAAARSVACAAKSKTKDRVSVRFVPEMRSLAFDFTVGASHARVGFLMFCDRGAGCDHVGAWRRN
eukprot:3714943-Rhodomonas_salina.2